MSYGIAFMIDAQSTCCSGNCSSGTVKITEKQRNWLKLAIGLTLFTILYALLEGGLTIWLGFKDNSVTLESFGLDSLLEISAAVLLLCRLFLQSRAASDAVVEASERTVHRFVGLSFLVLAAYVLWMAFTSLLDHTAVQSSPWGLTLTALSVIVMPSLAITKLKVADRLGSEAMRMEAKETLACAGLSFVALGGLALNAWLGWWWADPVASLFMLPWFIKEGFAGVRGVSCCG